MSNPKQSTTVPITDELSRFFSHINGPDNKRILFSAGFGAGKTYFLDQFFKENKKDFHFINLFPVDYSVTPNSDIFEIIKFDVMDALLEKYQTEIKLSEEDISQGLVTQEFLRNEANYYKVFKVFAKHFIPMGEAITESIDVLKESFDAHNTFSREVKKKSSESAEEFIKIIRSRPNSVREMDGVTLLIRDFLNRVRAVEDKPFVLIIDDLDRLDPEHIFRIFNVFTAHHNSRTEENKFGFDRVVFVCDVNNIEYMFHHRFGAKAEFAGYIDKFYSTCIFQFRHRIYLKELFHDIYIRPKINTEQQKELPDELNYTLAKGNNLFNTFNRFVKEMIEMDAIRIRNLIKFSTYGLAEHEISFNDLTMLAYHFPFLTIISLSLQLVPRLEDLEHILKSLSGNYEADYSIMPKPFDDRGFASRMIEYSLPFIAEEIVFNHNITAGKKILPVPNEHGRIYEIHCELTEEIVSGAGKLRYLYMADGELSVDSGIVYKPNPYHFFLNALKFCRDNSLIE